MINSVVGMSLVRNTCKLTFGRRLSKGALICRKIYLKEFNLSPATNRQGELQENFLRVCY